MAITSKELAEGYFQQAVNLEKLSRKNGLQNFDQIFNLYEKVIQIDPNHGGAWNNLACLYLERKQNELDEIEQDRADAKVYYKRAIKLGQTEANHNLRLLNLVNVSEEIKDCEYEGRAAEDGRHNRGKLDPSGAISQYQKAEAGYDTLISHLKAEYARIQAIKPTVLNSQLSSYKKMIAYNTQLAVKRKASLQNMCDRNKFYMEGLECERMIGKDGNPDYAGAIEAYQKAENLGHVAAKIKRAYLLCSSEKIKEIIEGNKENDPNGIFTQPPVVTKQKTMEPGSVVSKRNVLFPIQGPLEESLKEKKMLPSIR
jgi:TPR repeat protein